MGEKMNYKKIWDLQCFEKLFLMMVSDFMNFLLCLQDMKCLEVWKERS